METFRTNIDKKLARCEEIKHEMGQIIHDYNVFKEHGRAIAVLTLCLPGGGIMDSQITLTDDKAICAIIDAIIEYYRNELSLIKDQIDISFNNLIKEY